MSARERNTHSASSYEGYRAHRDWTGTSGFSRVGPRSSTGDSHACAADYSRDAARYRASKKGGMSLGKKIAVAAGCTFCAALIAAGVAAGLWYYDLTQSLAGDVEGDITNIAEEEVSEPYYVLVLGSDSRSENGEGARSDSMIVARIDEAEQEVSLMSIPRDLYVNMGSHGYQKINAATVYGGYDYAIEVVNELLDIEISYYVFVYFSGFEDLVDTLGGVTVEVPEGTYYDGVWVEAGDAVTINGKEALVLARCRKGYPSGTGAYAKGDAQRTLNQRNLIKAIASEVLAVKNPAKLTKLLNSLVDCVDTNMGVTKLLSLVQNMKGMDLDTMQSGQVPVAGSTDDSIWVAVMYEDVWQIMRENFTSGRKLTKGIEGFDDEFINATVSDAVAGDEYWYTYYEDKYGDFTTVPGDEELSDGSDDGDADDEG